MKAVFVALSLCVVLASAGIFKEEEYQLLFSKWMTQHNKKFSHENFFYRYTVFKNNLDFVVNHNKKNLSYTVGMNAFGDQTTEEFAAARNGFKNVQRPFLRSRNGPHLTHTNIPAAIDWRTKNAVTAVKDQGQCGSCWAFSTTGSTEGAVAIASKKLISLSEQQLMDCSSAQGNQGCNGGLMDQAFEYIIANKGICSEASYPYLGYDSTCNQCTAVATITGYTDVTSGDENALQAAAAIGPVSIAIEADQSSFQFYQSGIFSDPNCGTNLDHGVLVVGYYTSSKSGDTPYWIVKNSWGSSWGDNGYIMMIKGQNECGLALQPSYPTGAKAL